MAEEKGVEKKADVIIVYVDTGEHVRSTVRVEFQLRSQQRQHDGKTSMTNMVFRITNR